MRQMACHPDLVLRSKSNAAQFVPDATTEATVCRLCNEAAEDAIQSKCRHIFDRECIKQYLDSTIEETVSETFHSATRFRSNTAHSLRVLFVI